MSDRYQLIWTKQAIDDWQKGKRTEHLLAHRISAQPLKVLLAFEKKMRPGVPRIIRSMDEKL